MLLGFFCGLRQKVDQRYVKRFRNFFCERDLARLVAIQEIAQESLTDPLFFFSASPRFIHFFKQCSDRHGVLLQNRNYVRSEVYHSLRVDRHDLHFLLILYTVWPFKRCFRDFGMGFGHQLTFRSLPVAAVGTPGG